MGKIVRLFSVGHPIDERNLGSDAVIATIPIARKWYLHILKEVHLSRPRRFFSSSNRRGPGPNEKTFHWYTLYIFKQRFLHHK